MGFALAWPVLLVAACRCERSAHGRPGRRYVVYMGNGDQDEHPSGRDDRLDDGSELARALSALGDHGKRALGLLRDAGRALDTPHGWERPHEIAMACCRGALESLFKLAGEDHLGPQAATRALVSKVEQLVTARLADADADLGEALDDVAEALEVLQVERRSGMFRVRQISHLVRERTRVQAGTAEQEAARAWGDFYTRTSAIIHGSEGLTGDERQLFSDIVDAVEQLFLALRHRAGRLHVLAELEAPGAADAAQVAAITDPRARWWLFQNLRSPDWLRVLDPVQLLPDPDRWPAGLYLERLCVSHRASVASWFDANLPRIAEIGVPALCRAVQLAEGIGAGAAGPLRRLLAVPQPRGVLSFVCHWAISVPAEERDGAWVGVSESLLKSGGLERGEVEPLLEGIRAAAYPSDGEASACANMVRFALAGVLKELLDSPLSFFDLELENDLRDPGEARPSSSLVAPVARACLDLAKTDRHAAVDLVTRTRGLSKKLGLGPVLDRLLAVHLLEALGNDGDGDGDSEFWEISLDLAPRLVANGSIRADVADFLTLVTSQCPQDHRDGLFASLTDALGIPPSADEIRANRERFLTLGSAVPRKWKTVWKLSPILPTEVLQPWQVALTAITEIVGDPPPRPEPLLTVTTVRFDPTTDTAGLAERVATEGILAVARYISVEPGHTPDGGSDTVYRAVAEQPELWAQDPTAVAQALEEPELQNAYFEALRRVLGSMNASTSLPHVIKAAFALVSGRAPQPAPATSVQPLELTLCELLQAAWQMGVDLEEQVPDIAAWLDTAVRDWTEPSISDSGPQWAALHEAGGQALIALIYWARNYASATGAGLPERAERLLDDLVEGPPDDRALEIVGACLRLLHRFAPDWFTAHRKQLLSLDQPWRPARTWLVAGAPDTALLAEVDRAGLLDCLRSPEAGPALEKTYGALLEQPRAFGDAGAFLEQLSAGPGGPGAVAELLRRMAWHLYRPPGDESVDPVPVRNALKVWQAALAAALPAGSLYGAGAFAHCDVVDDMEWLDLTWQTLEAETDLDSPQRIAERAAGYPDSPKALRVVTRLLGPAADLKEEPGQVYRALAIERSALAMHQANSVKDSKELAALREALIEAGHIDLAFYDTAQPTHNDG